MAKQRWESTNDPLPPPLVERYQRLTNWVTVLDSPGYRDYFDLDEGGVSAPQTNTTFAIDLHRSSSPVMSAVMREGALWTCHHVGLSGTNGTYTGSNAVNRSAVQWIKISTDTNGQFLSAINGRIYDRSAANPYYYYFPSLMVNKAGGIFRLQGHGTHRSLLQLAQGGWHGAKRPQLLQPGLDRFTSELWGDYSATSLDPTDELTFWTVQQYADVELEPFIQRWSTWISEIIPDAPQP
jgi:hypothetical protein